MTISKYIQDRMKSASWIRRMFETGNELRATYGPENVFDFTLGNPTTEPPPLFSKVLREVALSPERGTHRYMSNNGYLATREAVARGISGPMRGEVSPQSVVMSVGAAGAINISLKAILDPRDEVLYLAPFFPEYRFYIENHQGVPVVVESNEDFSINIENIAQALSPKTKALILNTPNNPTGILYSEENLVALNSLLLEHGEKHGTTVYVICDEPYRKLVYDAKTIPQTLDIFQNGILCTSHSKDLGLPGERIGFAVVGEQCASKKELLAAMVFSTRTLGFVNAPALMQRVVAHLQEETVEMADYKAKRDLFYGGLRGMGYELPLPGGAFYLFVKSPIPDDVAFVQRLLGYRVLAVPGVGFGRAGWVRLSYCVDKVSIERALPLFQKALEE